MYILRFQHQRWLTRSIDAPTPEFVRIDQESSIAWQGGRCDIEDFEQITSRLKDSGDKEAESEQLKVIISRLERLFEKVRLLEQHVRDTMTISFGNLSLQDLDSCFGNQMLLGGYLSLPSSSFHYRSRLRSLA